MPEFTTDIVIDIPVLSRGESGDFFVFAGGTAIRAVGFVRGLDIMRMVLSHSDLRRPADRAHDPVFVFKARVRYPFLFLGAEETNPLLYREF